MHGEIYGVFDYSCIFQLYCYMINFDCFFHKFNWIDTGRKNEGKCEKVWPNRYTTLTWHICVCIFDNCYLTLQMCVSNIIDIGGLLVTVDLGLDKHINRQ